MPKALTGSKEAKSKLRPKYFLKDPDAVKGKADLRIPLRLAKKTSSPSTFPGNTSLSPALIQCCKIKADTRIEH